MKSSISGRTPDAVSWAAFLAPAGRVQVLGVTLASAPVMRSWRGSSTTSPSLATSARHLTTAPKMIQDAVGWLSLNQSSKWPGGGPGALGAAGPASASGLGKVAACVLNFKATGPMRALVVDTATSTATKPSGSCPIGRRRHDPRLSYLDGPGAGCRTADDLPELHWLMKRAALARCCALRTKGPVVRGLSNQDDVRQAPA
ncbi:hypothetical protein ACRAWD_10250 [Caulobacter segnis]